VRETFYAIFKQTTKSSNLKTVLFIKRNQQIINEENARRDFFRFLQDEGNSKMRKLVEDSPLSEMLNENFINTLREEKHFSFENSFQKLYEFAAVLDKKWNKKKLRVLIVKQDEYSGEIINAFNEWGQYTDIEFFVATRLDDSDIRVTFERNSGHWSFIGREAENFSLIGNPTLNFDPSDLERLDSSKRFGIFLHEIGHSLGLIHEHQKENSPIVWSQSTVYNDCEDWFSWDKAMVDHNIFNSYNSNELFYSKKFDIKSIMIYAIPSGWSTNYQIDEMNTSLSEIDKSFAKAFYSV
jgi:hypothetical protein